MKKFLFAFSVVLIVCLLGICCNAEEEYTLAERDGVGYRVYSDHAVVYDVLDPEIKRVEIPAELYPGCPVLSIDGWAFASCENLVSVSLPEGLEEIHECAFIYCYNLEYVNIPSTVTFVGKDTMSETAWIKKQPQPGLVYLDNWCIGVDGYGYNDYGKGQRLSFRVKEGTVGIANFDLMDAGREDYDDNFPPIKLYLPKSVKYCYVESGTNENYYYSLDMYLYIYGYSGSMAESWANEHERILFYPLDKYKDIKPSKWYTSAMIRLAEEKIIIGDKNGNLMPDEAITREELITILFRYRKLNEADHLGDVGFSDVEEGKWYSAPIKWAKEMGYVKGIGHGKFGLGKPVTREELAVILRNVFYYRGPAVEESPHNWYKWQIEEFNSFVDSDKVSSWAVDSAIYMIVNDYMEGISANNKIFAPKQITTRAQAIHIINKCLEELHTVTDSDII